MAPQKGIGGNKPNKEKGEQAAKPGMLGNVTRKAMSEKEEEIKRLSEKLSAEKKALDDLTKALDSMKDFSKLKSNASTRKAQSQIVLKQTKEAHRSAAAVYKLEE